MGKVILGDWLNNNIQDKSIDVIMADPPYFEVKGEFDFIWASFEDYLKDVEKWAVECKRVLKDNGSLFWWGDAKKIAHSQVIIDKYLNIENSLVWENTNQHKQQIRFSKGLRSFAPITERCLFYSNEVGMTSLEFVEKNYIAPRNPYSIYLKGEFKRSKTTNKEISKLFPSKTGGLTGCVSNWLNGENIITENQYDIIRKFLGKDFLNKSYDSLRSEYDSLRSKYEELRRPFENIYNLGDVIKHANRETKDYAHDTIKPVVVIKQLLKTTTRKDSKVLIPFGGSGTDVEACIDLGLDYECYDIEPKHYETIKAREKECLKQPSLFDNIYHGDYVGC